MVEAAKLRRSKSDQILLEGPQLISAALDAGVAPHRLFSLRESELAARTLEMGGEVTLVTEDLMSYLSDTQHPRGPVAVARRPDAVEVSNYQIFVLWDVQDPGNVGTLIRTAAVFELGVVVAGSSADPWGTKALRSSAGGCFATPVEHAPDLTINDLRERRYTTVGLVTEGGLAPESLPTERRLALMIGNEARGLPRDIEEQVDLLATIPMAGWPGSLNAAAAGAVVAYWVARNRQGRQEGSD
ncbi:MAG: TrmH family RNA methyltransferase [Acidimicrobiia bacterium]